LNLTVRQAARLLKVSEKTIYQWIEANALPAKRIHDQFGFNRVELLEWATAHHKTVSPDIFREPTLEPEDLRLVSALRLGGISYELKCATREEVLRQVVEHFPLPDIVDRDFLFQVLLAREELGSTGIGDGIAIPHVRQPLVLNISRPLLTLGFLEKPVDFKALDGKLVQVVFTLISPTIRTHLHLLSCLGFVLRDKVFKSLLRAQAAPEKILETLTQIEKNLQKSVGDQGNTP
jgi:nitrogen PTS system EIIA component